MSTYAPHLLLALYLPNASPSSLAGDGWAKAEKLEVSPLSRASYLLMGVASICQYVFKFGKIWQTLPKFSAYAINFVMATMNVSLPDKMREWIDQQVSTGRYANASDLVRDLIRDAQLRTPTADHNPRPARG